MKIVNVMKRGSLRLGFQKGDSIIDALTAARALGVGRPAWFKDTISFIKSGDEGLAAARKIVSSAPKTATAKRSAVKLGAPIIPTTILASGSNYIEHNQEKANLPISGKEVEFFIMTGDCVIGTDEDSIT